MRFNIVVIDVFRDVREQLAADLIGPAVKNDEIDRHVMLQQEGPDGIHCNAESLILRIAEDAGRNERERYGLAALLLCQPKTIPVAGDELFPLAILAAAPDRADGVDDVPAGQPIGPRELCLPDPAAAEPAALRQQLRSRRAMDAAVHAASAEEALVCRVDDGIHGHFCDVVADEKQGHGITSITVFELFVSYHIPFEKARNHPCLPCFSEPYALAHCSQDCYNKRKYKEEISWFERSAGTRPFWRRRPSLQ